MPFRPIYAPRTKAKEYCDLAINIYTGCPHGCTYCYARKMSKRFTPQNNFEVPTLRPGIIEATQEQLKTMQNANKKIMLCFTCDPYPIGYDSTPTRKIIQLIKESGNHVQILTKSNEIAIRDFDLLDSNDSFGITWSGDDELKYEKNCATYEQRHRNLIYAKYEGIQTFISCEPVVNEESIYAAIQSFGCVDLWRIGKMNGQKSNIDWKHFGKECKLLCKVCDRDYYIKEELRKEMEK